MEKFSRRIKAGNAMNNSCVTKSYYNLTYSMVDGKNPAINNNQFFVLIEKYVNKESIRTCLLSDTNLKKVGI